MTRESFIIRKLDITEINDLYEELKLNGSLWGPHRTNSSEQRRSALKDGKSIIVQWCDNAAKISHQQWDLFPTTHAIIKRIVDGANIGRVYWHRLLPGENILPHSDEAVPFVKSGKLQTRYQIYLDVDEDVLIYFGGDTIKGSVIENSVIDFPLKTLHYYENKSDKDLYLLVFDTLYN